MKLHRTVVLVLLVTGCRETKTDSAPTTASATPSASSPVSRPIGARALALAPAPAAGDVDKLIDEAQRAVAKLPNKAEYWVVLGRYWVRKARESADPGFYANADACADVALEVEPENRLALGLRAQVALNQHEFARAMDLADQALAKAPDDLVALGVRSDACLELGRFDAAVDAAQRMVDLKPNLPSYVRAAYLKWLYGKPDEAKNVVRLAIDAGRDPRDKEPGAWALVQAAMLFWGEGDYDGAEAGFDRALARFADFPPALVGKGRAALNRGDGKRAAEYLQRAYDQSPLVETAWYLGDAKAAAGDSDGAASAYAEVVKRGRQTDHRTLALFYATKKRDTEEAVKLAEAEKSIRGDIATEDALAWSYYRAGRFKEAKLASDRATRLGTRDAQLWYHAGAIKLALGDKPGGVKQIKAALKLSPKFDVTGAAEATELVANAEKGGK